MQTSVQIFPVGHRGAPGAAPENTLASYDAAIRLGARMVEFDVRVTKDGHFVLMHDATVDRTTNGSGRVDEMTLAEIKALDAGSWKHGRFAGMRAPTLREALHHVKGRAAVDIDFKAGPENAGDLIADILDEEGYRDGPLVTVFARARHYDKLKGVIGRYVLRPHYRGAAHAERVAQEDGIALMGLRRRAFSFDAANDIRDNGMTLFTNTMGFADNARGFEDSVTAGARFIQTDHLDRLTEYLAARGLLATCIPAADFSCWNAPAPDRVAALEEGR